MGKLYSIEITNDDFTQLEYQEKVSEENIEVRLKELAPDCKINFKMIFTDKRCMYFQHYMPANKTTAKHSYKKNHELRKLGNEVKVYITEYLPF